MQPNQVKYQRKNASFIEQICQNLDIDTDLFIKGLPEHVQEEDKPSESLTRVRDFNINVSSTHLLGSYEAKRLFSMQPDEVTSKEREAVLNEGEANDVELPPESQLRDQTAAAAEGQEGKRCSLFSFV